MNTGAELIAAERQRQINEEGFTLEHDQKWTDELVRAAYCYLVNAENPLLGPPSVWPWHEDWWTPSDDPVRNLVKAGALIAAEIDRLQRAGATTEGDER